MIRAFLLGVRQFRSSFSAYYPDRRRSRAFDCGREFAHIVTFGRFES